MFEPYNGLAALAVTGLAGAGSAAAYREYSTARIVVSLMDDTRERAHHLGIEPFRHAWGRLRRIGWGAAGFVAAVGVAMVALEGTGALAGAQPVIVKAALVVSAILYACSNTAVVLAALKLRCPVCREDNSVVSWLTLRACGQCELRLGFVPPIDAPHELLQQNRIYR